jgi:hypothetical protein
MAEAACFILIDGEMLIEEHQLAQGVDLSLTIKSGVVHLAERAGLNAVDVGDDPGYVLVERRGHLPPKVVSRCNGCAISRILTTGQE